MTEPAVELSTPYQRQRIRDLESWIAAREQRAHAIEAEYQSAREIADREYHECQEKLDFQHETRFATLQGEYLQRLETARTTFESANQQIHAELQSARQKSADTLQRSRREGEDNWEQTRAIAVQNYENDLQHAKETTERMGAAVESWRQQASWLEQRVRKFLVRRGQHRLAVDIPPSDPDISSIQLIQRYTTAAEHLHEGLKEASQQPLVRFVDDGWPILLGLFLLAVLAIPMGLACHWQGWHWLVIPLVASMVLPLAARYLAEWWIRRQLSDSIRQLSKLLQDARIALIHADEMVRVEARRRDRDLDKRKNQQLRLADETWRTIASDLQAEYDLIVQRAERTAQQQLQSAQRTWDTTAATCREKYVPQIERCQRDRAEVAAKLSAEHDQRLRVLEDKRAEQWHALIDDWYGAAMSVAQDAQAMQDYSARHFSQWQVVPIDAASDGPVALPFGHYRTELADFPHGTPRDPRLHIPWTGLMWPSVLSFPQVPSLLIETEGDERADAIRTLQSCMLRFLLSFPPGKVRFTIMDPTGLGENFSTFMHLSDYDERLVNNRIWTESSHIQQKLADLTEHMENVIQKYLRNEFASIQVYNERAGEIAEPFQILVVANFPANFSDEAARRLISIATSGARCGVYFLISVDRRLKLPNNFDLNDLRSAANALEFRDGRFRWQYEDLARFPLALDDPPPPERATALVKEIGRLAKAASRVEVPFAAVTPPDDAWWTGDSQSEINVPLGRAGATQLQYLQLGPGTSQHVLVAGKTGSGKSTLLNTIITNLALYYAPDQLQFYLVDFKKGVEFKAYAEHRLPHARVIAIESEREFGMSVLERLDAELQSRGEQFRQSNVQSLAAFRAANPDVFMPRILLIIDEFQEFFVKDDKIAHEASLLLDRLVRQGRAFGIHVLLGSQTLAGAYSLARSTLGQMAVRIALQCSESDAHLILSEENTAARLLNRPGEAIYNNANGRFEGNHPFQVVWLPDHQRADYLHRLAEFASRHAMPTEPAIVFEGNVAAALAENQDLVRAWQTPPTTPDQVVTRAWLGSPVAIKDATHVVFRRQSGAHLMIVGQQEHLAMGILASSVLSIAASQPWRSQSNGSDRKRAVRFVVLDGGTIGTDTVPLRRMLERWPHVDLRFPDAASVANTIQELGAEFQSRWDDPEHARVAEPIFLVIYHLARFRELRTAEDDFGLGSFSGDAAATPSQTLAQILRDGSSVGMHCLVWCDSYVNLTRWFSRQTLRDIAYRVLFQMSAADSSNLMDSAAASQLGPYRAILYDDERGEHERFRPYDAQVNDIWPLLEE